MRKLYLLLLVTSLLSCSDERAYTSLAATNTELGKHLFFDTIVSKPAGQSFAMHHASERGFIEFRNTTIFTS